jgi:hypothetical protein
MISLTIAAQLVQRFSPMPFFLTLTEEGINELIRAIARADSVQQAEGAVQRIVETLDEKPAVKDILDALANTPSGMPGRDRTCPHCAGSGLRTVWHVECDTPGRGSTLNRVLCGSCAKSGNGCQALVVPLAHHEIGGLLYCEARVKQASAQGVRVVRSAEACPACRYGQSLGVAYRDREVEKEAKKASKK